MVPRSRSFTLALSLCALCSAAAPALALDVDMDPARIFIGYTAPSGDSGPLALSTLNNTPSHPFILPCDVQTYGPQIDIRYLTDGPTLYPQLQSRFYALPNTLIWSAGHSGLQHFSVLASNLIAIEPFTTQTDGQPTVSIADPVIWDYVFQPTDLPANQTVRHSMHVELFRSSDYTDEITDDNPTNNSKLVYVRRVCP